MVVASPQSVTRTGQKPTSPPHDCANSLSLTEDKEETRPRNDFAYVNVNITAEFVTCKLHVIWYLLVYFGGLHVISASKTPCVSHIKYGFKARCSAKQCRPGLGQGLKHFHGPDIRSNTPRGLRILIASRPNPDAAPAHDIGHFENSS